jgi:hypothetical protein
MASDIDIANRALQKLGEARIASVFPPDNLKSARAVNAAFNIVRDNELRAHWWNFAKARTALPADAAMPSFGYNNQYTLPSDCLRVRVVGNMRQSLGLLNYRTGLEKLYVIEGRKILTDLTAPLSLEYSARVSDTSQWDACFVEVFACKLAEETCYEITQSDAKREGLRRDYKRAIREAVLANAIELPPEGLADDSFVLARQ